eukprot:6133697-Alexandrium_andersonii.AAC.1
MSRGRLENRLHPEPLGDRPPQVHQRGCVVCLKQDTPTVAEPPDARHCLVDRIVVQPAFAKDRMRQDRPGLT